MPSPLRNKHFGWLLLKTEHDILSVVCVAPTFRAAYQLALFELQIAKPNLVEKSARVKAHQQNGTVRLYDKLKFSTEEEATYSPVGQVIRLQKVPIKRI